MQQCVVFHILHREKSYLGFELMSINNSTLYITISLIYGACTGYVKKIYPELPRMLISDTGTIILDNKYVDLLLNADSRYSSIRKKHFFTLLLMILSNQSSKWSNVLYNTYSCPYVIAFTPLAQYKHLYQTCQIKDASFHATSVLSIKFV